MNSWDKAYKLNKDVWSTRSIAFERLIKKLKIKGQALDLGCGLGSRSLFLAKQGYHVEALDFSREAIIRAKGHKYILYRQTNLNALKEKKLSFSKYGLIIDFKTIKFIKKKKAYLHWINSKLSENGYFILGTFLKIRGDGYSRHYDSVSFYLDEFLKLTCPYFSIIDLKQDKNLTIFLMKKSRG